jgi:transposase InsO family protein
LLNRGAADVSADGGQRGGDGRHLPSAGWIAVGSGNVTENPTAQWTGQQIVEAFPWDCAPKYLLRDRDAIYDSAFQRRVKSMGIEQVLSAPRSPWQNPFVERLIGTLRRDCRTTSRL